MISANKSAQLFCLTHNTRKEPLTSICLTPDCLSKGLLCSRCIVQSHSAHDDNVISFYQLTEDLHNCSFDKSVSVTLQKCVQQVKDARAKCLADITRTRQHITKALDDTQQWLITRFDEAEHNIAAHATSLVKTVPTVMEVDMTQQIDTANKRVTQMVEALTQYRTCVTQTIPAGEDISEQAQRLAKEAIVALTEVSENAVQRLTKLLQPLSVNTQPNRDMPLPAENQWTGVVW
jgi:hypothetical protein